MYIETITTPNPDRYPEAEHESFMAAAGINEAADYIAEAPDQQAAILSVADYIQEQVGRSLHYVDNANQSHGQGTGMDSLETLATYQEANCAGYTIAGSEAMSAVGINHYVAYANGHFFLVVPFQSTGSERLAVYDFLSPHLNADITKAISYGDPSSIKKGLAEDPNRHQAVMLDTTVFARAAGKNIEDLQSRHAWLARQRSSAGNVQYGSNDQRAYFAEHRVVASLYTGEAGREVIQQYIRFHQAIVLGNTAVALEELNGMRGRYPENDCRDQHTAIRALIGKVCLDPELQYEATAVIDNYCSSFKTTDPRASALRGDLLRNVARMTGDHEAAQAAAESYDEASHRTSMRYPKIRDMYDAKRKKVHGMAAALLST